MTLSFVRFVVGLLFFSISFFSCKSPQVKDFFRKGYVVPFDTTLMEMPRLGCQPKEHLISHCGFNLSYNPDWVLANWVAYELTAEETRGRERRRDYAFAQDPDVMKGAVSSDYTGSGYSRGHLAPAADMKWDACAMRSSFYFTNICPQNPDLNAGCWERLERRCRGWAKSSEYGSIFVVCGPVVKENAQRIGANRVVVPDAFYKVVLRKKKGKYEGIGFVMPNRTVTAKIEQYAVSIDEVEALTKIDFFHNLPDEEETEVEAAFKYEAWNLTPIDILSEPQK